MKLHNASPPKGGVLLPLTHLNGQNYDSSLGPQMWDHVEWYFNVLGSTFLGHAQCFFQILIESSKWIYQDLPQPSKASYWKRPNVCSCKFSNQDPCLHGSISNPNWIAKALGPPSYQVLSLDRLRDEGSVISCGFLLDGMLVQKKSTQVEFIQLFVV